MNDSSRRAVFLDRDGTLIHDTDYLTEPAGIRLLPGAAGALRRLKGAGFLLLVVTNQSAVARGWLTEERLDAIHRELQARLGREGAGVDAFYHCPHLPGGAVAAYARECDCRKPEPGLLLRAAREWGVDLRRSWMVGDSERDAEAGRRAGCRTVLLGDARSAVGRPAAADLASAAGLILERSAWDQ